MAGAFRDQATSRAIVEPSEEIFVKPVVARHSVVYQTVPSAAPLRRRLGDEVGAQ